MTNEVRLIDADALIEKAYWHGERPDPGNIYPDGVGAVDVSDIEDAPTIDPESLRPKGRWGVHRESEISKTVYCTNCWAEFYIHRKGEVQIDTQPYCPNCGAKMEG